MSFFCLFFSVDSVADENRIAAIKQDVYIFSNSPESIKSPGLMFERWLEEPSLRYFYHHRNVSDDRLALMISVTNTSSQNMSVSLAKGLGGSGEDIVYVGHTAAYDFLNDVMVGNEVIDIPAGATVPLVWHVIKQGQTSSGIVRLEKKGTTPLLVKSQVVDIEYPSFSGGPNDAFVSYEFQSAYRDETFVFDGEDKVGIFEVGGKPYVSDVEKQTVLKGNYGVFHFVTFQLKNTTDRTRRFRLFVTPARLGGVDRAVMWIDDRLVDVGVLHFDESNRISEMVHEVVLVPRSSQSIRVITFPQSGCFYPIDFELRSIEVGV